MCFLLENSCYSIAPLHSEMGFIFHEFLFIITVILIFFSTLFYSIQPNISHIFIFKFRSEIIISLTVHSISIICLILYRIFFSISKMSHSLFFFLYSYLKSLFNRFVVCGFSFLRSI